MSEFDPVRFAVFTCKTCHGAGVENDVFDMPNPDLPQLDPTRLAVTTVILSSESKRAHLSGLVTEVDAVATDVVPSTLQR